MKTRALEEREAPVIGGVRSAEEEDSRRPDNHMETSTRHVSVLIPYRKRSDGQLEVFLQQRDGNAPSFPNYIGFFGGGIEEGETPEAALGREIQEELCIEVLDAIFVKSFEVPGSVRNVFTAAVEVGFEDRVKIREGEFGIFLSEQEVAVHTNIIPPDQKVLLEVLPGLRAR